MKSKTLKFFMMTLCLVLGMSLLVGCANGCTDETLPAEYEEREVGDFVVRFYKDYCEIKGTTKQGNNQRFLVIPEFIDGVRVESLGEYNPFNGITMLDTYLYIRRKSKAIILKKFILKARLSLTHGSAVVLALIWKK